MNAKRNAALLFNTETNNEQRTTNNSKRAVNKVLTLFVVSCSLLVLSCRAWAKSNAAIKAFNQGVKAFNAKQFNEAIPFFDDAISADSEFTEAYFARGACKYYLKSLDGALLDLNDAIRLKPDYLNARALRGAVNYESDRWDDALGDFNYVLEQNPHDAQSLLGRGVILLKREKLAAAEKDFKGFLRERPDDPLAPKVRQLVASLKRTGEPEAPGDAEPAAPKSPSENPTVNPPSAAARNRGPSTADLQKLADSLLSHPLEESSGRKVLRGEKAEVVGDFHGDSGVPDEKKPPDDTPQIVDPQ